MSQHHLRKEKTCLNCGYEVHDKYCSHCGQLNAEPRQSFGHLLKHFFSDVTHWDSQFLATIKDLLIRPGFLTKEYEAGKRASYLDPIKMYIFISAVFFLVMSSQSHDENKPDPLSFRSQVVNPMLQHLADSLRAMEIKRRGRLSTADSVKDTLYQALAKHLDTPATKTKKDTTESITVTFNNYGVLRFMLAEHKYSSVKAYDAMQDALPVKSRDNWFDHYTSRKIIRLTHEKGHDGAAVIDQDIEHDVPKVMFVLLPLFAFFIGLFYSRKKYFYSQHFIFSMHFHSFVFIVLLASMLTGPLINSFTAVGVVAGLMGMILMVYLITGLRTAYSQSLWLSAIKGIAISLLYFLVTMVGICIAVAGAFVFL